MYSRQRATTRFLGILGTALTALILAAFAAPVQAQLEVAADIQRPPGNRALSDARAVAAGSGEQVVIEVFAAGIANSLGFEAIFEVSDPSAIASAAGSNQGGPYTLPLASTVTPAGRINLTVGGFANVNVPSGAPRFIGSLTLTLSETASEFTIKLVSADPGTGAVPQDITLSVVGSLPIVGALSADLNPLPGNQNVTSLRVNPNRNFPVQMFATGMDNITGYELHATVLDPANWVLTNARFETVGANSVVTVEGNTVIAKVTGLRPVSGAAALGQFSFITSAAFRGGQITITRAAFHGAEERSQTLSPNIVLTLGSVITDAPIVTSPPIPLNISDTFAIIQWATNKQSIGEVRYGTAPDQLTQSVKTEALSLSHRVRIQPLQAGTRYFFKVVNTDAENRTSDAFPPLPVVITTRTAPDTQPPVVLRGPVTIGITHNHAQISVVANEAVVIQVNYGLAESTLDREIVRSTSQLEHNIALEQLTANTQYFYRVRLTDLAGNITTTPVRSFRTQSLVDAQPPRILGRPSVLGRLSTATVIAWQTDKASNSTVFYGTDQNDLSASVAVENLVRDHTVTLSNLLAGEQYFYRVRSADAGGIATQSDIFHFTTQTTEDTTPPLFVRPPIALPQGTTAARIVFATNEPTTAIVQFATTQAIYEDTEGLVGEKAYATSPARQHEITLTNLEAGTRYFYKVLITDLSGNGPTINAGRLNFATRAVPDTSPPVIFGRPIVVGITENSAIIQWEADEPHSAIIRYGIDSANLDRTFEGIDQLQRHAVTLTDLQTGTPYFYEVQTTDAANNTSISRDLQFTTLPEVDTTPPVIVQGPVVRNITTTSATIDWETNEPADSRASYGLTSAYTATIESPGATRIHSITLTSLEPGTQYHFAVGSADQSGNLVTTDASGTIIGVSKDHTFRTLVAPDTTPPIILAGPRVHFSGTKAQVSWTTDKLSTSRVVMGVRPGSSGIVAGTPVFGEASQIVVEKNQSVRGHSVIVTGLSRGVNYVFQVSSTDDAGNTGSSQNPVAGKLQPPGGFGSFTTSTEDDTQFPVITRGPTVVASTANSLTVEWETDEVANAEVRFGTSDDNLSAQEISGTNQTTHRMVLTKLAPGTTYAYDVGSTDISGNGVTRSKVAFGTTPSDVDLTAPVITAGPEVIYKTDRAATIRWITNEAANSTVSYGTAANELINVRNAPEFETEHVVTLTNLSASTTYHYRVGSTDQSNNGPTLSAVVSFTTDPAPDTTPPVITDVAVSAADSSALITWKTDEQANSAVRYGTVSGNLGLVAGSSAHTTTHGVTLTNLQPNTTYFYIVQSIDRSGNGPTNSAEASFTTRAAGDLQAPQPPSGLIVSAGNAAVRVFWAASPSSGVVGYNVERAAGDGAFAQLTSLSSVTSFVDNNVQNGTAYRYRIASVGLKQTVGQASNVSQVATPAADGGPSAPRLFTIQGNQTTPTFVINNSTPVNAADRLTYTFHIATSADFSDAVALDAVVSTGAGIGTGDPSGITAWTSPRTLTNGQTYHYRVRASDGTFNSTFLTGSFTVNASAPAYPGDLSGDRTVGFPDFLLFVGAFGKSTGQAGFLAGADFTGDGSVGFPDFLTFVSHFGKRYIQGASGSGKPVVEVVYGTDDLAQFQLIGRPVAVGAQTSELSVDVRLSNVENLKGYGVRLKYDPAAIQFLSASDAGNMFKNNGRFTELFATLDHNSEKGEVFIANALPQADPVSGEGILATLRFRLIDTDPSRAYLEIAQGLLIDGKLNANAATNLGGRFSLLPNEYALERNFPNPFNPETAIRYAVPKAGGVTLVIYNVLGQEITRLVDAEHAPGFYTVRWNGKDAFGRSVASGVYLYRLHAGDFAQAHKMLLLK